MSYILDALKKVEHEKVRKAHYGGMTNISGDLFREQIPGSSTSGAWKVIVVIAAVSLVIFAVTWFLLKSSRKQGVAMPSTAQTTAVNPASQPLSESTAQLKPADVISHKPLSASKNGTKKSKEVSTPTLQKTAIQTTIPSPSDIKVSGIAWQEEHAARRVVVNGLLLQEGTMILGAKIIEIQQNKVRFKSSGGFFDVPMDTANLPTTPK